MIIVLDNKHVRHFEGFTMGIWANNENKGAILSKICYRSVELDH